MKRQFKAVETPADDITLYQYPKKKKSLSLSPFCLKLETYLRMAGIRYTNVFLMNPSKAPKGKLPYININGELIGDSGLIITALASRYGSTLERHLTTENMAVALMVMRMLDEHLYWCIAYERWVAGWTHWKQIMFAKVPVLLRSIVANKIQRHVKAQLKSAGMGRHSPQEVFQLAVQDLEALDELLGKKEYVFESGVSTIDAAVFAFIASIINTPWDFQLKAWVLQHKGLVAHYERMTKAYFPEANA